jgi:putative hemolysin
MDDDSIVISKIIGTLVILMVAFLVYELFLANYAIFNADTVECNLGSCAAKTTRNYSTTEVYTEKTCYENGVQIDCSNFTGDEHFCNGDKCEMNGVTDYIQPTTLANPASVYCKQQNYTSEIRTDEWGGQTGYCVTSNKTECEEWAYYRGSCIL